MRHRTSVTRVETLRPPVSSRTIYVPLACRTSCGCSTVPDDGVFPSRVDVPALAPAVLRRVLTGEDVPGTLRGGYHHADDCTRAVL